MGIVTQFSPTLLFYESELAYQQGFNFIFSFKDVSIVYMTHDGPVKESPQTGSTEQEKNNPSNASQFTCHIYGTYTYSRDGSNDMRRPPYLLHLKSPNIAQWVCYITTVSNSFDSFNTHSISN